MTCLPYLRAWLFPPPGTGFLGFFYYVDDQYNYLSYVEQAERGAFLFENKLVLAPHVPSLVNLEWWVVGRLSSLLGGRPFLAYRIVALGAGLALLAGLDRSLRSAGLRVNHRFPALLLVGLGGGLGGVAWRLGLLPLAQALDLTSGVFPFIELLANPHFVVGTALLAWTLWRLTTAETLRERALGVLLGNLLGLVRPYDLILLGCARLMGILVFEGRPRWRASLPTLLGLIPVVAYNAWVFAGLSTYGSFGLTYVAPSIAVMGLALGPAIALAGLAVREVPTDALAHRVRGHLALWAALAVAMVIVRPVGYALQFLVGAGAPLLALGALGLSRFPRRLTLLAAALCCPTAGVALGLVLSPNPRWYTPVDRLALVEALRPLCRPGDLLMAPPDVGLLAIGRTACKAYVSHPAEPDHEARTAAVRWFYEAASPAERAASLDRAGVTYVVLPGEPGASAEMWLGSGSRFERKATVGTSQPIGVFARVR